MSSGWFLLFFVDGFVLQFWGQVDLRLWWCQVDLFFLWCHLQLWCQVDCRVHFNAPLLLHGQLIWFWMHTSSGFLILWWCQVDCRVHCCLYFISPYGHGLKPLDLEFLRRLQYKVRQYIYKDNTNTKTIQIQRQYKYKDNTNIKTIQIQRHYKYKGNTNTYTNTKTIQIQRQYKDKANTKWDDPIQTQI